MEVGLVSRSVGTPSGVENLSRSCFIYSTGPGPLYFPTFLLILHEESSSPSATVGMKKCTAKSATIINATPLDIYITIIRAKDNLKRAYLYL